MPAAGVPSIVKSPPCRAVYTRLVSAMRDLGPFEIEEKKTSLHLTHGRAFAGIHPRATGLMLNLVLDAPLEHQRVHRSEQVSAHRHHVEFKLEDPSDVDGQLRRWIERAYRLTT